VELTEVVEVEVVLTQAAKIQQAWAARVWLL